MHSRLIPAVSLLLLGLVSSCNDITAPRRFAPVGANRTIDITVASLNVNASIGGAAVGANAQGESCFLLGVDGQHTDRYLCSYPTTATDLLPGSHALSLQLYDFTTGSYADVSAAQTLNLAGGQTGAITFDLSSIRAKVTGTVVVNGAAPAPYTYKYYACVDPLPNSAAGGSCNWLLDDAHHGQFELLVQPGRRTVSIYGQSSGRVATYTFDATAGQTIDAGTIAVQLANATVEAVLSGAAVGSYARGESCFLLGVDGQRTDRWLCSYPATAADLPPGSHALSLQQYEYTTNTYEDVTEAVTLDLPGGETSALTFDLSSIRAKVTGTVLINDVAPAPYTYQYRACVDPLPNSNVGSECSFLLDDAHRGQFELLAQPGSRTVSIYGQSGKLASFAFDATAGQTMDAGTISVRLASVTIDASAGGAVGTHARGESCFLLAVDGQRTDRYLCAFPITVSDFLPGSHALSLQQYNYTTNTYENVLAPTTMDLVGGQTSATTFDLSSIRGKVTGTILINGVAPTPYTYLYRVCVDGLPNNAAGSDCSYLLDDAHRGQFELLAQPGQRTGTVYGQSGKLASFTFISSAGQTTVVGGLSTAPGTTPTGSAVKVQPVNQTEGSANTTVSLTFSNVTAAGVTTVVQSNQGFPPPEGLVLGFPPVYFDLSTTATFTDAVEVCINYTGTTFLNVNNLKLLHHHAGRWTNVTTTHDRVNRIICGSVTSFSEFVVAEGAPPPADVTAPEITSSIDGTLGAGGWYTSDVSVTWSIADTQSEVTASTGCEAVTVTSDVVSVTYSCSATSAGGAATRTVTIKRDTSPPSVRGAPSGAVGFDGWYTSDLTVNWSASDDMSGVAAEPCAASTLGADNAGTTFTCTATDGAGLSTTAAVHVKRDASTPMIVPTVSGTRGSNEWFVSDVDVTWTVSSTGPSGVSPCAPSTQTLDTPGAHIACTASTGAGISRTSEVTVKRDRSIPVIVWTGARAYTIDQTIAITCAASDAMSGLASSTCANVSGPAYNFPLGPTTLSATATDVAGNTARAAATYSVSVTSASLCTLTLRWLKSDTGAELCNRLQNRDFTGYIRAILGSGSLLTPERAALLAKLARKLSS